MGFGKPPALLGSLIGFLNSSSPFYSSKSSSAAFFSYNFFSFNFFFFSFISFFLMAIYSGVNFDS
jgi:hypothetical protein